MSPLYPHNTIKTIFILICAKIYNFGIKIPYTLTRGFCVICKHERNCFISLDYSKSESTSNYATVNMSCVFKCWYPIIVMRVLSVVKLGAVNRASTHVMLANDWLTISHLFKCCSDSNYLIVAFDYYTVCRKQKRADASIGCYLHSNTTATEWVGRKYGLCQCREWRQMTHSTWIAAADRKNRKVKKARWLLMMTSRVNNHTLVKRVLVLFENREKENNVFVV